MERRIREQDSPLILNYVQDPKTQERNQNLPTSSPAGSAKYTHMPVSAMAPAAPPVKIGANPTKDNNENAKGRPRGSSRGRLGFRRNIDSKN